MFAYCNNNPINFVDPAGTSLHYQDVLRSTVGGAGAAVGTGAGGLEALVAGLGFVIDGINHLVETIDNLVATYNDWNEKHNNALSEAKAYAKSISGPDERYVVHHIVAKGAPLANPARNVLKSVDINPRTNGLNLAVIPQSVHLSLHTTNYYMYINSRLIGLNGNRSAVEETLVELQIEIQIYCQTGFKVW